MVVMKARPTVHPRTIMLFLSLFVSLLSTTFAELVEVAADPSKCSAQLQGILNKPQTYSYEYMTKVAAHFRTGAKLLFTPQSQSYIDNFQQQYGVSVAVNNPTNICGSGAAGACNTTDAVVDTPSGGIQNATFTLGNSGDFGSMSLNINLTVTALGADPAVTSMNLTSPSGTTITLIQGACIATSSGSFSFILQDGAAAFDCTSAQTASGQTFAPLQPLSTFAGESLAGTWLLSTEFDGESSVDAVVVSYCEADGMFTCSSDVAEALMNFPGFRYDAGTQMVYWTEEIFNCDGQMQQVTISRPVADIFVKK